MRNRLPAGAFVVALLLVTSANAWAESMDLSLERPVRRAHRAREWRGRGIEDRTVLRLHAGISAPTGDFGDAVNTGWGTGASVGYGVSRSVLLSFGLAYHRFGEEFEEGHVGITPITFSADYGFPTDGRVKPWVSGGLGVYHINEEITFFDPAFGFVTVSDSDNDFGLNFGFGIATPVSPRTAFGAGFKFHHIVGDGFPDTDFLTVQAGFGFML